VAKKIEKINQLKKARVVDVQKKVIMLTPLEVKHGPNFFKHAEEEALRVKQEGW
jgi:hypothetical protein